MYYRTIQLEYRRKLHYVIIFLPRIYCSSLQSYEDLLSTWNANTHFFRTEFFFHIHVLCRLRAVEGPEYSSTSFQQIDRLLRRYFPHQKGYLMSLFQAARYGYFDEAAVAVVAVELPVAPTWPWGLQGSLSRVLRHGPSCYHCRVVLLILVDALSELS